ncbi:DoxX family protein [Pseudochrobactrum sp. HB0163]|uniref:DoxX family protein n=1 Tax=Pseudochrobactrum sp. HB0163 TaxID=3450708 RepID=UPI003F6DDA6E
MINPAQNSAIILIARIFLSILFILAGWSKLSDLEGTTQYFLGLELPAPMAMAVIVGLIEFIGGLAILIGFKIRIAAAIIALFTIGTILVAHLDFSQGLNIIMAQKNLAITGGLLLLIVTGAGLFSVDGRGRG